MLERVRTRARRNEVGASLVEFALIAPVFLTLLLGMVTGGLAYDRKLNVTAASRETARYAATLPLAAHGGNVDTWLGAVAQAVTDGSDGALAAGVPGREVCVAYIAGGVSRVRTEVGPSTNTADGECFADGRPAGEPRIQVVAQRTSTVEVLFASWDVNLRARAVARFEALP